LTTRCIIAIFNCLLEIPLEIFKNSQEILQFNGTYQHLALLDDESLLDRTINIVNKEAEIIPNASLEKKFVTA
jgi:hypothetical protein